ncbi:conjugal transfer protein TraN [Escherichia coli]|nr:conjugal transfer protein TraN [Escherichia coli]
MNAVLSVQGASAPVKKKSFFSKFTRLNMLRLVRAVLPAAVLMMFFPQLAMASGSQDLMASGNSTVKATFGKDSSVVKWVVRAFTGQAKFCKKAAAGYSNCCKDSGWGQDIGLAKCSSDEKALAKAKSNKLTVSVGEFCSKKVLGVCLEKKRSYCQFDSKLAQIVQQQGRNGQLRISFGSAKHPDCRGITVDELQKIQFNRLDFTNFYEDLMNNQKIPDSGVLTQKVKEQIADQLKQAGQ